MSEDTKLIKQLIKEVGGRPGWRVVRGGKHHKVFPPAAGRPFQIPVTPSDPRWRLNLRSRMRHAGWTGRSALD